MMKNAIVSLSFDDGRYDNLVVFQHILTPMSIPITINITTGYVDGTCPTNLFPTSKRAVAVQDVIQLGKNPLVEIALHGDRHLNTEEDIAIGREKLINWLESPMNTVYGFASPGCGMKIECFTKSDSPLFAQQILYMRTGLRIKSISWIRILCRKIARVFHVPFLFRIAYEDTLMIDCKDRVIYSVPVMKDTTYGQVKALIDLAIKRRCALTLMFHSVVENTEKEDNWSWERRRFLKLCEYIDIKRQEGLLEVMTTQELAQELAKS